MTKAYLLLFSTLLFLGSFQVAFSQAPEKLNAAEIYQRIQKLNFLGSALYVAAHPDDENQRLISYLSNEVKAVTTYIAMTRGDGGQNEIGPEIQQFLGVIRTQELLKARSVDGGNQHFSRANDFGFSKNPEETLEKWGKTEALADMVWAIRKWQPDIIINRFQNTVEPRWKGRMHGHHTASAMLSYEAYDLTNDPEIYPEQLKYVDTWQPHRLFFNTSWWFYGSRENFEEADKSRLMGVDVGAYYPLLGKSNTEIAAAARSMHKAQGFGDMGTRGSQTEYLELLKGEMPENKSSLFAGINTSWSRVEGGAPIGKILADVESDYDFSKPSSSIPQLMKARKSIMSLSDGFWKRQKLEEIEVVIQACMGLFLEVVAEEKAGTPGGDVALIIEAINRSDIPVTFEKITFLPSGKDTTLSIPLSFNEGQKIFKTAQLPSDMVFTSPYWLKDPWQEGRYTVKDQEMRGLPQAPKSFRVRFDLLIDEEAFSVDKEVIYKYEDAVKGEVYQPFEVIPPVFTEVAKSVYVFNNNKAQDIEVVVKAGKKGVKGTLMLDHPEAWSVSPAAQAFELDFNGQEKVFTFQVTPPGEQAEGILRPKAQVEGKVYSNGLKIIDYPHIPVQHILTSGTAKLAKVGIAIAGNKVGYIMGLGDDVPVSLEQIGYEVTLLDPQSITLDQLQAFDAVILGVRVYNGVENARQFQPALFEYIKKGGTVISQYNKNYGMTLGMDELAPYPLKISRDRVTVEEAPVEFLVPDHTLLNHPNKITEADFDGWIQERGLYFPNEWSEEYTPIIASHDPEEPPRKGGLLVAQYGEGYYIYTGYSWFRQLPAGVPGAFRLFANMISIGQQ